MPVERKLLVRDGDRRREVLLVGTVIVGRSPSCEISAADPRLSREHAAFEVVGDEVVVRDLGSRNGTRVNGARISEQRLKAGDTVEVGPFTLQLVEAGAPPAVNQPASSDDEATVLLPPRAPRGGGAPDLAASAPPAAAAAPHPAAPRRRASAPVEPSSRGSAQAEPAGAAPRELQTAPRDSAAAAHRAPARDLAFARATLIWIVPVALVSFLAGLVPDLLQPDERTPLLRAHYLALASSAAELVRLSREPGTPLDSVTSALRRQTAVTSARILGADGRVLAPLDEAGSSRAFPQLTGSAPHVVDTASGIVEVHVPATTADGRSVVVALVVDPSIIHPAPAGSAIGTLLLLMCLGTAWLVARRVTSVTDSRLSRLGEEVELMTTGQVSVGHDPFGLRGGQRILDAATFALSPAGRQSGEARRSARRPPAPAAAGGPATASIDADAGFRIVRADAGCEALLGLSPGAAAGLHLIDALRDQAVADEVLRLVTLATPDQGAQGEAAPSGQPFRLGIDVTRGRGEAPLTIRFTRL